VLANRLRIPDVLIFLLLGPDATGDTVRRWREPAIQGALKGLGDDPDLADKPGLLEA
jgi:hypothetical protein